MSLVCQVGPSVVQSVHTASSTQKNRQITEERWAQPEEEWTTHSRSHAAFSLWRQLNEASCTDQHTPHYQRGRQPGVLENGYAYLNLDPGAVGEKSEDSDVWSHTDNQDKKPTEQQLLTEEFIIVQRIVAFLVWK